MIAKELIGELLESDYKFITGVPDSIFKHFLIDLNKDDRFEHVLANNEGESCALAAGYHLATGKVPLIYLQNSGFGNCLNPLTSLLDSYIYSIPALLFIGWRGVPGEADEPQHRKMGEVMLELLTLLGIPYSIADASLDSMKDNLQQAAISFKQHSKPYAIVFPKDTIKSDTREEETAIPSDALLREDILTSIVNNTKDSDILVTTTGKTSRELYEIRERLGHDHCRDFLTVGSMGCASTIALGIAKQRPDRRVIVVDGDGACLMRMESLVTIGAEQPENLIHVLIDNNAYESTGAQQTLSHHVDFAAIAKACGYREALTLDGLSALDNEFARFEQGPQMWVIKSYPYSRPDLGRPKSTPLENKQSFMRQLGSSQ